MITPSHIKVIIISYALLLQVSSNAQYFNLSFEETILSNPIDLQANEESFLISALATNNGERLEYSYYTTFEQLNTFDTFLINDLVNARNGVLLRDEVIFIGPSSSGLGLGKLDLESGESELSKFPSPDGSSRVGAAAFDLPFAYATATISETDDRENLLLRQVNVELATLEKEYLVFEEEIVRPFCYEIISQGETLLLSSTVGYASQNGSYDNLIKIDVDGNKIWEHRGSKRLINGGATLVFISELSNGNIVQVHKDDKEGDVEFFLNDWTPKPSLLRWFSPEGQILKEVHLLAGRKDRLDINQLETGSGDYFFAYGNVSIDLGDDIEDDEDGVGLIIKYSNEGDTIWSRQYRHPDYDTPNNYHFILDVEELPGGDLLVLGAITPESGGLFTWLFRINECGCFGDTECDGIVTSKNIVLAKDEFLVYPNPAEDLIEIIFPDSKRAVSLDILTIEGRIVSSDSFSSVIDISEIPTGTYICRIVFEDGVTLSEQFLKY